jgi:hypothetical protein
MVNKKAAVRKRKAVEAVGRGLGAGHLPKWAALLDVRPSKIQGAGMGLFAKRPLSKGYTLPVPYRGRRLTAKQASRVRDGCYLFLLNGNGKYAAIDAKKTTEDNPLRYANGARTPQQQRRINLKSAQRGKDMFFVTTRRVAAAEELLLDYGPAYWPGLRRQTRCKELGKEASVLRAALRGVPPGSRTAANITTQLQRLRMDLQDVKEGSDSESEE